MDLQTARPVTPTRTSTADELIVEGLALRRNTRQTSRMFVGERMVLPCKGGPTAWRAVTYPPPVEFAVDDGTYVLVDDGPEHWAYEFVPDGAAW